MSERMLLRQAGPYPHFELMLRTRSQSGIFYHLPTVNTGQQTPRGSSL